MMIMETTKNNYGVYMVLFTNTVDSLPETEVKAAAEKYGISEHKVKELYIKTIAAKLIESGENAQGISDALMVMGFSV